jgi:phosphoketolase
MTRALSRTTQQMRSPEDRTTLARVDAWWRAATHLARRLPGGSRPAVAAATLTYAHLNRMIVLRDQRIRFVLGVSEALPALAAVARMEGTTGHRVPRLGAAGGHGHNFTLAHAVGAVLGEPDLIVAALVSEEEARTAWPISAPHDPTRDGTVLPILYNPTMDRDELRAVFGPRGWDTIEICEVGCVSGSGHTEEELHRCFSAALYVALDEIEASTRADDPQSYWPMLVLRTPDDWPPIPPAEEVAAAWFDADGRPVPEIAQAAPTGEFRMSAEW